ncbi:hypothetical protein VFPBJ_06926 [Purpureocillium lilacinum]|uniref:Uncharacterized protein n=1 Tax=Purpureocillium lilacinum TaxID=33203 RepID=A0A179GLP9_PURLI|nr:hypothetical protein VFPBJ_06926 [Purpureocillium lilacinum]
MQRLSSRLCTRFPRTRAPSSPAPQEGRHPSGLCQPQSDAIGLLISQPGRCPNERPRWLTPFPIRMPQAPGSRRALSGASQDTLACLPKNSLGVCPHVWLANGPLARGATSPAGGPPRTQCSAILHRRAHCSEWMNAPGGGWPAFGISHLIMGDAANFGIHFAVLKRWRRESPQRSLAPAVWQAWRTVSSLRMSSSREANCSASERCRTPEALC